MKEQLRNSDRVLNAIKNVKDNKIAPMEIVKIYENSTDLKYPVDENK